MKDAAELERLLQIALGALADISTSGDMTLDMAQRKAARIYYEVTEMWGRIER